MAQVRRPCEVRAWPARTAPETPHGDIMSNLFLTNPMLENRGRPRLRHVAKKLGISTKAAKKMRKSDYSAYKAAESGFKPRRKSKGKGKAPSRARASAAGRTRDSKGRFLKGGGKGRTAGRTAGRGRSRDAKGRFLNPSFGGLTGSAEMLVSQVPVVGDYVAPFVTPLIAGAVVAGIHYAVVRYGTNRAIEFLPESVKPYVEPFKFTLTGIAAATGVQLLPLSGSDKTLVSGAALIAGAAFDVIGALMERFGSADEVGSFSGIGQYAGLGTYAGVGADYSGLAAGAPGALAGLEADYSDADLCDADYCSADFSDAEGQALLNGAHAWRSTFGQPPSIMGQRQIGAASRHAGKHGHRWGWLIKVVGPGQTSQIAALNPRERQQVIAELRSAARAAVHAAMNANSSALPDYGAPGHAGPMGASDAPGAFGGLVYAS